MQLSFLSVTRANTRPRQHSSVLLLCLLLAGLPLQAQPPGSTYSPFRNAPVFLDVDDAFRFYVSLDSDEQISVHWQIAPGYYLYADKFSFRITAPDDVAGVLIPLMPAGVPHEDEYFGKVSVYYQQTRSELKLPLDSPRQLTLEVGFQGCAEAGLCYPPELRLLEIQR
jgi:thioredoxin:protein disulfide reductase